VLFNINFVPYLVHTEFLSDSINAYKLQELIFLVINKYFGDKENLSIDKGKKKLIAIATDNAEYCIKGVNDFSEHAQHLIHMRCYSHIISLIGDALFKAKEMIEVKNLLRAVNSYFLNSSHRKHLYRDYLRKRGFPVNIPPQYYEARWGSFYDCLVFMENSVANLADFIVNLDRGGAAKDTSKAHFKALANIFVKTIQENADSVALQHEHVSKIKKSLSDLVKATNYLKELTEYLEKTSAARVHKVYDKLMMLKRNLEEKQALDGWREALAKLNKYLDPTQNRSIAFLQACRVFDPTKLHSLKLDLITNYCLNIEQYASKIPVLQIAYENPEKRDKLLDEWMVYTQAKDPLPGLDSASANVNWDIVQWWKDYSITRNCIILSSIAISCLSVPVSSIDAERTFSKYRDILTIRRHKLEPKTLESLLCLYWNVNIKPVEKRRKTKSNRKPVIESDSGSESSN
jgi:hypothetical protein